MDYSSFFLFMSVPERRCRNT